MPGRSAAFTCSWLLAITSLALLAESLAGQGSSLIVKPRNETWLRGPEVEIIARAEEGRLLLDGQPVDVDGPFPGVLYARLLIGSGRHSLRLDSPQGTHDITFYSGESPPFASARPFVDHPPVRIDCTHCHGVSRRGRFRFSGGCESCHAKEQFIQVHSHEFHELASCGMCHDAHGSTAAKLLLLPVDKACKQCHN